ncbi:hypothetical protein Rsub_03875 [Raphidocelis subcapitata]|uniref:AMP-dependent synthetase/ligase domain-containing protein n=1 Tax=Raphidocelis subcapitata TaxID=307507 RepID=A0A2V0NZK1_9CHLO|nr:hypothetical protein Rsub_03875 [Raphidocelis subcapitata]|eukprot:GBF91020.1 hypothetical protein Rsub_03875 [Raphidocelis subcapitata]
MSPAPRQRYPMLIEVAPGRRAARDRPAVGPTYVGAANGGAPPTMPGGETLYELFSASAEARPGARCLGHRPIAKGVAGPYEWQTFGQVRERVAGVAAGMRGLGLEAGDKVAILGVNCPDWMVAMQVGAPARRLGRVAQALAAVPSGQLAAVVHFGPDPSKADLAAASEAGARVLGFGELEAAGRGAPVEATPPAPEDLSTVMYTSGTTGNPKGVMLTHHALVSAIAACKSYLEESGETLGGDDCYFSFLPLAHVFDRLAEEFMLAQGGCIGYWQGEIPKVLADIAACRPTLFCGVPRVFDRIHAGISDGLRASWVKRFVFGFALARKKAFMQLGYRHDEASPLADLLVFNKIKQKLGGRVRLILSGAAPLSPAVQEFLAVAMCAPVLQGYGLTETCAATCIAEPFRWEANGTVGGPISGAIEVRLEAVPEMGYDPAADPPRGEVCVRGPTLFGGYYKEEGLTAECMDAEGFFHTGDIAELTGRGALRIIDRKKNIFKLSQGEYVAVEKVEGAYKGAPLMEQALVSEPRVAAHFLKLLQDKGRAERLKGFELVKAVHLVAEPFSVENGLMTPTFKFKRAPLLERFRSEIDDLYARLRSEARVAPLETEAGGKRPAAAAAAAAANGNGVGAPRARRGGAAAAAARA